MSSLSYTLKTDFQYRHRNIYHDKLQDYGQFVFRDREAEQFAGVWNREVFKNNAPIAVEIGPGYGHFMLEYCQQYPLLNFVGIDYRFKRGFQLVKRIGRKGLSNVRYLRARGERLHFIFGAQEVDQIFFFFPDPWAKSRQRKNGSCNPHFWIAFTPFLNPREFSLSKPITTNTPSGWPATCKAIPAGRWNWPPRICVPNTPTIFSVPTKPSLKDFPRPRSSHQGLCPKKKRGANPMSVDLLTRIKGLPISEVLGHYVALNSKGQDSIALCPFHNDSNPSLQVSEKKGLFKCFACGVGGDAITFVEKYKNIPFKEALVEIAQKFNLPSGQFQVPQIGRSQIRHGPSPQQSGTQTFPPIRPVPKVSRVQ